jgi:hypothetical protein
MAKIDDWGIDEWWTENNAPVNLFTVGRINFSNFGVTAVDQSRLNKTLNREDFEKILVNHDRIRDFYHVGPVQRAALEQFVDDLLKYISKS